MIPLKITYRTLTIRSRLEKHSFTFKTLLEYIKSQFPSVNDFHLKYWDEENALIDLRSEADLKEALYLFETFKFPVLRLLVLDRNQFENPIQNHISTLNRHPLALKLLKEISNQHEKINSLIALHRASQKQEIPIRNNEKNLFPVVKPQAQQFVLLQNQNQSQNILQNQQVQNQQQPKHLLNLQNQQKSKIPIPKISKSSNPVSRNTNILQCSKCLLSFSRPDALRRHQMNSRKKYKGYCKSKPGRMSQLEIEKLEKNIKEEGDVNISSGTSKSYWQTVL